MGFLEYAWSIFFEKDQVKTKLLMSSKVRFPQLSRDEIGFVVVIPEPSFKEGEDGERMISLMGYRFPDDTIGKRRLVNLYRAAVFHAGGHVFFSNFQDYEEWRKDKNPLLAKYTISIVEDVRANGCLSARYNDKLADLALANTLALKRLRRIDRLMNPATRAMAGLLMQVHTGQMGARLRNEQETVARLANVLSQYKQKESQSTTVGQKGSKEEKLEIADSIYYEIEDIGPITEAPFLPHTEELGSCSIFSTSHIVNSDIVHEEDFKKCLEFLGGKLSDNEEKTHQKMAEAESSQVFDSWQHQKEKEEHLITKYEQFLPLTQFKSIEIPEQDYTEFLRVKSRSKSEGHRLIESLLVARDAVDEDPAKMYGVLDLQEVIQVIASKSPRMDVFMLDENLSKSYSWVILLDASRSMKHIKDFALEILLTLAEVANEILIDPTSWGIYAFNDRFFVVKDLNERYNTRVAGRLGGIKFEDSTYMPDALTLACQLLKTRPENMRLVTIISDGWPLGYSDVDNALSQVLSTMAGRNITVIGIGANSRRAETLFKSHCTVYDLRDLSKKFSNLYFEASRIAAET